MNKIILELKSIFQDTVFIGGDGEFAAKIAQRIEYSTPDGESAILAGRAYEITETTAFDINSLNGIRGEGFALTNLRKIVVVAVKTAETVSGTLAIACPLFGISSGTVTLTSDTQIADAAVGEVIALYVGYSRSGKDNGSGNDITITMGTPVGYKVLLLIAGDTT